MALLLAVIIALMTLVSVGLFAAHVWWLPAVISTHGPAVDHQFVLTMYITGVIFVLAQLALAYLLWKHRDRGDGARAQFFHGNNKLEATWTIAATILFVGLNLMGYRVWAGLHFMGAEPGAHKSKCGASSLPGTSAIRDRWQVRPHACGDIDDATGNYLGLDREHDPDAKDDIVTATWRSRSIIRCS